MTDFIDAVKEHALVFAESPDQSTWFRLKSGLLSSYYINCRKLTTHSDGLFETVKEIWGALYIEDAGRVFRVEFDAFGGPCVGADYIVGAMLYNQGRVKKQLRGFGVRKEAKGHGVNPESSVFGTVKPGDRVIVIEDVTLTGDTLVRAVDAIVDYGCTVVKALTIVDRQMGAADKMAVRGIEFQPLVTIDQLGIEEELKKRGLN